jgi:hypothetical protein
VLGTARKARGQKVTKLWRAQIRQDAGCDLAADVRGRAAPVKLHQKGFTTASTTIAISATAGSSLTRRSVRSDSVGRAAASFLE